MRTPVELDPDVDDEAPTGNAITAYDERHYVTYLRLLDAKAEGADWKEVARIVRIFRELRNGQTEDGKSKLKTPSSTLSTAEAISVINNGMALAGHFGDGVLRPADMAAGMIGAVVKDPVQDQVVWTEYLETVVKERADWKDLYRAFREQL